MRPPQSPEGAAAGRGRGKAGRATWAPARGHARGRDAPGHRSQGPSPPSRSPNASPLPQQQDSQQAVPVKPPSAIHQLVSTATSKAAVEARVEALRDLPNKLQDPASAAEIGSPGVLMAAWNKILQLLADPDAPVRQAAAPVVGCLGGLASKQSSRAGVSPGLLFDWAIPLMTAYATEGVKPDQGSVYWALSALQHGLQGCNNQTVTRYGNALLDACQRLLEADTLPEHLLPLLLHVISQASRAEHSFRAHFQDLAELLVGWSFEPKLTENQRGSIFGMLASFRAAWAEKKQFAAQLLTSLLADADRSTSNDTSEQLAAEERYNLLAYVGCSAAIVEACGSKCSNDLPGVMQRVCHAAGICINSFVTTDASPSSTAIIQQLCNSALRLYKSAISALPTSAAPVTQASSAGQQLAQTLSINQQHHHTPLAHSARHADEIALAQQQPEEAFRDSSQQQAVASAVQTAHMAVLELALQACTACTSQDLIAELTPVLTLFLQACRFLREQGHLIPLKAIDAFLRSTSIIRLDLQGGSAMQNLIRAIAEVILGNAGGADGQYALQAMLTQMTESLRHESEGSLKQLPNYQVKLVGDHLRKCEATHAAATVWVALRDFVNPQGHPSQCHEDRDTIVVLLADASAQLISRMTGAVSRNAEIRAFWLALAQDMSAGEISIAALQWLVRAALQCHAAAAQGASQTASGTSKQPSITEQLARLQLTVQGARIQAKIVASGVVDESVIAPEQIPAPQAFATAAVAAVSSLSARPSTAQRMAASQSASKLLQPDGASPNQRSTGTELTSAGTIDTYHSEIEAAACSSPATIAAVLEDSDLVQLGHTAVKGLNDVSAEVAASWQQVLEIMGPSIMRIASNARRTSLAAFLLLHKVQPFSKARDTLSLQGDLVEPQQLSRLLDWLTQASPAILVRSQASASTAETGADRKDAEMREWVCQLASAKDKTSRSLTLSSEAIDWAVEVAARQLIRQRLRTHYGGAVQTLAALEKGLLSRLSKCNQALEHHQRTPGLLGGSALLSFALALERQIQSACFGALALPSAAADPESQSFFAAPRNQMACTEWYVRLRPSLLKLSAALAHHTAAAHHGLKHLESLQRQIDAVLAPTHPPDPSLIQQAPGATTIAVENASGQKQSKPAKRQQQRQAVPVKVPEPARILKHSTASDEPETAADSRAGSGQPGAAIQQPSDLQDHHSQAMQPSHSLRTGSKASAQHVSAREKLLQDLTDTLWTTSSALAALGRPDEIAGLRDLASSGSYRLSGESQRDLCGKWMAGMEAEASGNLEVAAETCTICLQDLVSEGTLAADMRQKVRSRLGILYMSMGDYDTLLNMGDTGAATEFMQCLDSGRLDAAQQAAASMSLWDSETMSAAFLVSTDSVLCQVLAHHVRARHTPSQQPSVDKQAAIRTAGGGNGSDRRGGTHIRRRGAQSSSGTNAAELTSAAEPVAQNPAESEGALEALQAEEKRLHGVVSLFGSEGLQAAVPMIGDLCIVQEHGRILQLSSAKKSLPNPSSSLADIAAILTTRMQMGSSSAVAALVDCKDSWRGRDVGARVADIRPVLQLERLYRVANTPEVSATHRLFLVASAESALASGSFQLAQKLLAKAASAVPAGHSIGVAQDADVEVRKGMLLLQLITVTGHTDVEESAAKLLRTVLSGAPSAEAQAQAYLLLSQLSMPTTHQVADRHAIGSAPAHVEVQPCLASWKSPGIEELLEKAFALAPQHSASAVHAWRLFGDWLYSQWDMAVSEAPEQKRLHPLSAAGLKAAEAYCQAVRHAAGSACVGSTMSALLRVLQVAASEEINCASAQMQSALHKAIRMVPLLAWQQLIPQLFSMLALDKGIARQVAAAVLESLGTQAPSVTLFPALAMMGRKGAAASSEDMQRVLRPLKVEHGELMQEAQLLVQHLRDVACLWSEQWMHILRDVQAEAGKHSRALSQELTHLKRLSLGEEESTRRIDHRWQAAMAPVFGALDSVSKATVEQQPSTAYQEAFHTDLAPHIQKAIAAFKKTASRGLSSAAEAQGILKQITAKVEQYCRPGDLNMQDICPPLARLTDTAIPMMAAVSSAADCSAAQPSIASIDSRVKALGTKTRPKRLCITGSDGRRQFFLLKGREDLQLDERLMQMLQSANAGLQADEVSAYRDLHARTFAVIPLGPTTGLIEWVEHSTPLFAIYQAWQKRTALHDGPKAIPENPTPAEAEGLNDTRQKLPSPTEAFHNRLLPALKEAGVSSAATRDKWPLEVLKTVVRDLGAEVPSELLSRELFCGACSTADWLQRQRAYASSAAVMSMVGWLLGLGDRHLDNILLDFSTGEVVHIDFNVVFDQGLRLRVPEIVPFRLTQMLKSALGIMGTEGTFRAAAEGTLHAMRSSSTAQSELLRSHCQEASLVWNAGHHESALSKKSGLEVMLQLLGMRAEEASQRLVPVLAPAAEALQQTSQQLSGWLSVQKEASAATERAQSAHAEAVRLQAAVMAAQSRYQEAHTTLDTSVAAEQRMQTDLIQLRSSVELASRECRSWSERHAHTAEQLRHGSTQELQLPTHFWLSSDCRAPLGLVTSLTVGEADSVLGCVNWTGKAPTPDALGRCAAVDEKAAVLFSERDQALLSATAALLEYSAALQQILADDYTAGSQHAKWTSAFAASLAAHAQSLQANSNMEAVQVGFHDAWQTLQLEPAPPDVLMGLKALHISAQLAQQASAAAQERVSDLIARLSEAEEDASLAQLALAEQDNGHRLCNGPAVLCAILYNLRSTLHSVADGKEQPDSLWTVLDILKGAIAALQIMAQQDGEEGLSVDGFGKLMEEAERHAASAALVEAFVAPDLAACAAAGLNYSLLQEARAVETLQGDVSRLQREGATEDAADLANARLVILSQYRSLMDTAADASLILKPLSRLSRVYESSDPDTHSLQKDPTQGSNWCNAVGQIGVMDNLLRACFASQPAAAADTSDSSTLSAEQVALNASWECEERILQAHITYCSRRLAASACEVVSQLLGGMLSVQPGSQLAHERHEKSADAEADALSQTDLEANAKLEAADEHLDRLGQAGSDSGKFGEGDESWLEMEAQLQSSQDHSIHESCQGHSRDQSMYAGEDAAQLAHRSGPVSERGATSEQQELHQQSLLAFDEGPDLQPAAPVQAQAVQMVDQMLELEENAHQPLPTFFGGDVDDSIALEGLLEAASESPSNAVLDSLESDSVLSDFAAQTGSETLPAHDEGELPSFFQPDEGTSLIIASELEPNASLGGLLDDEGPADDALKQGHADPAEINVKTGHTAASPGSNVSSLAPHPQLDQDTTGGSNPYEAFAAAPSQQEASQASILFRPLTPAAAQEHRLPQPLSQPMHPGWSSEQQKAVTGLQEAVLAIGRHACLQEQLDAFLAALTQAEGVQQAKKRAISRYEWMHEGILGPAGVLGPPVQLTQQGQAGWQLQRRRRELLEALDASIRHLLSLEEPLNSWAAHSAQAEAVLTSAADQAGSPVQARLRHFLQLRTQWLNISGEHVASVARVGQAVLHLELSREGRAWVSPSGISSGCEGYGPLMERMQRTCIARLAAASEAERCTVGMASLTDEFVCAQPALTSAAEAEDAAVAAFACCTPNLLRESAALKQQLAQTLASADSLRLGLPHLYMVTADLRQMSAQDTMPSDAFEELAKGIMTSNSCLKGSLPAIATSLRALLAILPGQETAAHVRPQPRRQSAMPTADAMRRAADLLEAGGRHMPAFESQVALTQQAGEAAAALLTHIPSLLSECSAGPAILEDKSVSGSKAGSSDMEARAAAWKERLHKRQKAHAEQVHSRFMHKLMGTSDIAGSKAQSVRTSSSGKTVAVDGASGSKEGAYAGSEHRKAFPVKKQVDFLIREATNLDNLAQMYEGWSAWI